MILTAALAPDSGPIPRTQVSATRPLSRLMPAVSWGVVSAVTIGTGLYAGIELRMATSHHLAAGVLSRDIVVDSRLYHDWSAGGADCGYCENIVGDVIMRIADIFLPFRGSF